MTRFRPVLTGLIRITDAVNTAARMVCYGLLAVIVLATVMQVVLRYVFNNPTSWSEEASMFSLVWFGMLAVAIGARSHWHIGITYLRDKLPPLGARILDTGALLSLLVFALILVVNSAALAQIVGASVLPASGIPKALLYYSVMAGGGLMALNAFVTLIAGAPEEDADEADETLLQEVAA